VGPSPPQTITASASTSSRRSIGSRCGRRCRPPSPAQRVDAVAASCSPIQAELVSTIWPSSSSVPTARTSQRTPSGAARTGLGERPRPAARSRRAYQRYCTPLTTASPRRPTAATPTATWRRPRTRARARTRRRAAGRRSSTCQLAGRDAHPLGRRRRCGRPDDELAGGDDRDRDDPEHLVRDQGEHGARARAPCRRAGRGTRPTGGAVLAGEVAVDAVADAQHEPQHERQPRAPRSGMTRNMTGDRAIRPTVMALAHVASAFGSTRHQRRPRAVVGSPTMVPRPPRGRARARRRSRRR
jgi:hypothetical protein